MPILALICLLFATNALAQTPEGHNRIGLDHALRQEYAYAIDEFSIAIKMQPQYAEAYLNRGLARIELNDLASAIRDLDSAIHYNDSLPVAYVNRAYIKLQFGKVQESLPDLNRAIEIDSRYATAYTLRGQVRANIGERSKACDDFTVAVDLRDPEAVALRNNYCGNSQPMGESLMLDWPTDENWRIAGQRQDTGMVITELLRNDEGFENWTERATMMSAPAFKGMPLDTAMQQLYRDVIRDQPKAQLTFIARNDTAAHPWIIFMIESNNFFDQSRVESQLYYVVSGKQATYMNFRAIPMPRITDDQRLKWTEFFKSGKVVMMAPTGE